MTPEMHSEHGFSPSQLERQRLFGVGPGASMPEQPGDKAKRVRNKVAILAAATAADLGESWVAEKLLKKILKPKMVNKELINQGNKEAIQKSAYFSGIEFVEDMVSDELYPIGMNTILRSMTGLDEVSYTTSTARFIGGWTSLLSYASGKFGEFPFWKKPWNIINTVNIEAGIGILEELPGVGKKVAQMHKEIDRLLQKEAMQFISGVVATAVTGYHIEKNMVSSAREEAAVSAQALFHSASASER